MKDVKPVERVVSSVASGHRSLAEDSRTVALWAFVSRVTGFLRIAMLAAVLGPTFFGNLFQTVVLIPYVICELMAASLIPSFLAPRMIRATDEEGRTSAERLANGFLGVTILAFVIVALAAALLAPAIIQLITFPVADPAVRAKQFALGLPLFFAVIPQIVLFSIVGVGIACQHAHRSFGWATAAPILENMAMIAVLGVNAAIFGRGIDVDRITISQALLLGGGATLAVALHAIAQWLGAYRVGIKLFPRRGWRDERVAQMARAALPFCGTAGLNALSLAAFMIASGQIPGGAVAFHIGATFFNLPVALCARPVAAAQLPLLARHFHKDAVQAFGATFVESVKLALFIALPAGLVFFLMPEILAGVVSVGEMSHAPAIALVATVLFGLAPGVIAESVMVVSTAAYYARLNAHVPLYSMLIRFAVALAGMLLSLIIPDVRTKLLIVGLTYSVSAAGAATFLVLGLKSVIMMCGLGRWIAGNVSIAIAATLPIALVAGLSNLAGEHFCQRLFAACLFLVPAATAYLILQYLSQSKELAAFISSRNGRIVLDASNPN